MQRDIRHTFLFSHPPEVVWEYLTQSELLAQWLMVNDIKPVVGYKFQFKTKPKIKLGFDGTVYCEVLEVTPFTLFSYSWKAGLGGNVSLDSLVIWTLTPKDNGTELLLEHKGFKGLKNFISYIIMNAGWKKIGKRLNVHLNNYKK